MAEQNQQQNLGFGQVSTPMDNFDEVDERSDCRKQKCVVKIMLVFLQYPI